MTAATPLYVVVWHERHGESDASVYRTRAEAEDAIVQWARDVLDAGTLADDADVDDAQDALLEDGHEAALYEAQLDAEPVTLPLETEKPR